MRKIFTLGFLIIGLVLNCEAVLAAGTPSSCLPSNFKKTCTIPECLGVQIHFSGAPQKELDAIREAGFRIARMDFFWNQVETVKGHYFFEKYDQLVDGLLSRGIRPYIILAYSNDLYGKEGFQTPAGRKAFAAFAHAAVKRYKGKKIIWELWNEPNNPWFWLNPSADKYMILANAVLPAIRTLDPSASVVAPATSRIDFIYLTRLFHLGLLKHVHGVSVHPYRQDLPEKVVPEYERLTKMMASHCSSGAMPSIISGEWGYSDAWKSVKTPERQGYGIPRTFLTNLYAGIPSPSGMTGRMMACCPSTKSIILGSSIFGGIPNLPTPK